VGFLCEHVFEKKDKDNPEYSALEYDLYADLGLSIRKNHRTGNYEIFRIKSKEVVFSYPRLADAISKANELEGEENTKLFCGNLCPRKTRGVIK